MDSTKPVLQQFPDCELWFLDPSWQNPLRVDVKDVISLSVNLNVSKSSPGTFSATISNDNDKYMIPDDAEYDIKQAAEDEKRSREYPYAQTVSGSYKQAFLDAETFLGEFPPSPPARQWGAPPPAKVTNAARVRKDPVTKEYYYYDTTLADEQAFIASRKVLTADELAQLPKKKNEELYTLRGGSVARGRPMFASMQQVVIFLSARFPETASELGTEEQPLVRVFTGLIDTVSDQYGDGKHAIQLNGTDVSKWLKLSWSVLNPALKEAFGEDAKFTSTFRFANLQGWEIVKLLVLGGSAKNNSTGEVISEHAAGQWRYQMHSPSTAVPTIGGKPPGIIESKAAAALFATTTLHVQVDMLVAYRAMSINTYKEFEAEYRDRLEICYEVAKLTNFEFYADGRGDLWYCQPRFDNAWILCAPNPEVYVLRDEDVVTWNLSESDTEVVTRVSVMGQRNFISAAELDTAIHQGLWNYYDDTSLIKKYGLRALSVSHPFAGDARACFAYARGLMMRMNQHRLQGSVTIVGRPEIEVGHPLYISSRNMVYYIHSVDHVYEEGGQFVTNLGLSYGRKPWEYLPEEVSDEDATTVGVASPPTVSIEDLDNYLPSSEVDPVRHDKVWHLLHTHAFRSDVPAAERRLGFKSRDEQSDLVDLGTDIRILSLLDDLLEAKNADGSYVLEGVFVTSIRSSHSTYTDEGLISAHAVGRAIDLRLLGETSEAQVAYATKVMSLIVTNLATWSDLRVSQVIGPSGVASTYYVNGGKSGATYSAELIAEHADHVHIGLFA